jgi:hypothetical protein
MEATTWTNGTACLFADAGFSLFAKSLLRYQAPWLDALQTIPRLTRLEVSPGRFVYLLLRCGDYVEGMPLLEGLERANRLIHDEAIPSHERLAAAYPVSAIPFIGMYGDLAANSPDKHKAKMAIVKAYNSQGWEYPKLVNASWAHYGRSVRNELGDPARPKMRGLVTVRGDIGSSWEAWMMAAQVEHAAFRQSQRDVVSLRTLAALLKRRTKALDKQLSTAASEVAYLGDHAWNGSSDGSKALNLAVRQRRLGVTGDAVSSVRRHMLGGDELKPGMRVAVVNTLAWERECRVQLPQGVVLVDQQSGEQYADAVPAVPGLGARVFAVAAGSVRPQALIPGESPLALAGMRPLLYLDGQEAGVAGGWNDGMMGEWEAGPFRVTARIVSLEGAWELLLEVTGTPPQGPYELRFSFTLPWLQAVWRGESGGGFVTPGPSDKGGDSLLGIVGSVFAAGEGISAADPAGRERIDFVLGESGLAGLGGRTTARAIGTYGEKIAPQGIAVTMESTVTPGVLEWYLLGISQNYKEAFADQGGNRRWRYRCVMRRVSARFDDDELFRFAESQNRFAELVDPALLSVHTTALQVKGALVLGLSTRGRTVEVDLYNTSSRGKRVTLAGPLVRARRTRQADMLGRPQRGKGIFVGGKSFGKVVVDL